MPTITPNGLTISAKKITVKAAQNPIVQVSIENTPEVRQEKLDGSPKCIDPNFLVTILDPREIFVPMSIKRAIWLIALFAAISGIIYYRDNIKSALQEWADENNIAIMLLLYLYEPLLSSFELIAIPKYPVTLLDKVGPETTARQSNHDLAVVIPCHNSAEFIANTIHAALRHVRPNQIFLMDNGKSELPTDLTKKVAHDIDPEINYFWLPKVANKNWGQLFALKYINEHRQELTLVLITDDDTLIPPNFSIRRDFFLDTKIQAIAYPIRAISPYKKQPLLVKWQDLEYIKADLHKFNLDNFGSLDCPHGAAALVKREALLDILTERHNGLWYGEDLRIGYELKGEWRLDLNCYFNTLVPQTLLGKSLNLYHQRVRSWDQALLLFPWSLILKPLFTMKRGSFLAILLLKNSQIYTLYSTLMQIFRFPLVLMVLKNPRFWMVFAASNLTEVLLGLSFNYLKLPPYLRSDLMPIITLPIYKSLIATMGTLSFLRVIFVTGSIPRNTRSLGFQLGHSEVVMSKSSLLPRAASDLTIIKHLLPQQNISRGYLTLTPPVDIIIDRGTNVIAPYLEGEDNHNDSKIPDDDIVIENKEGLRYHSPYFFQANPQDISNRERAISSSSSIDRASNRGVLGGSPADKPQITRSRSAF